MPDRPSLAAASRTVTGKKVARLRHEGRLPAVVYGHGTESEPVTVDAHEFDLLRRHVGASTLVDLAVDGQKARPVIVHGIQVHPVTRRPLHVDLFAVRMTEELTVEVQLVGIGAAPAAESGGTLVHPTSSVKVRALPDKLPESLHVRPREPGRLRRDDHRRRPRGPRGRDDPGRPDRGHRPRPGAARRGGRRRRGAGRGCRRGAGRGCRRGRRRGLIDRGSLRRPARRRRPGRTPRDRQARAERRPVTYAIGSRIRSPSGGSARSRASRSASSAARAAGSSVANRSSSSKRATNAR